MQRMWKERTLRGLPQGEMFHTLARSSTGFHQLCRGRAGEPLYFDDGGQPVYTYMVSVPHVNKHLIKFPIALEHSTLRSNRNNAVSPQSTVLLKADTGADINLMNRKTFNQLFGEAKGVLQPTPINMENYRNTAVKVLGMFHAFLRWKDKVYKQLFYMTDCDRSPNLLSRDACYILGVIKPCYTVENSSSSTVSASKVTWWPNHFFIRK